jgi:hypothetical protein
MTRSSFVASTRIVANSNLPFGMAGSGGIGDGGWLLEGAKGRAVGGGAGAAENSGWLLASTGLGVGRTASVWVPDWVLDGAWLTVASGVEVAAAGSEAPLTISPSPYRRSSPTGLNESVRIDRVRMSNHLQAEEKLSNGNIKQPFVLNQDRSMHQKSIQSESTSH